MAKINIIHNNFTSGELSPHIFMRTELAQYRNGLKESFNMLGIVEGGIKRRGGTAVLIEAKNAHRIIPFMLSHAQSYILVFKHKEVDILTNKGQKIRTLTTPYNSADTSSISYSQDKYNLYLAHDKHPLAWIRVSEDLTNWDYSEIKYSVPPLDEVTTPIVAIKPNETAVGKVATVTASQYEEWNAAKLYKEGDICYRWKGNTRQYYQALMDISNTAPDVEGHEKYWQWISQGSVNVFSDADRGKYIFINEGIIRVDTVQSGDTLSGEVLLKLNSDVEAIARSWVFKLPIFSSSLGYPRQVSMYQQRLILGGSKKYPNYIWFSRVDDISNFLPSTVDGDSFTIAASSDQLSNVLAISQSRGVVIFTGGAELAINTQNALTPTNANIIEHSSHGIAENIKPIKVGTELLFVQRGSDRLRTLIYDYSQDGLVSNELTVLASHIPEDHGGFREMVYQQEPDSIIWLVMNDGTLATLTLNREQSVISWSRHDIGAEVLSIMTLPNSTGSDRLYFLVRRNGTIQIEQIQDDLLLDSATKVSVVHAATSFVKHPLIRNLGQDVAAYYKDKNSVFSVKTVKVEEDTLTIECDPEITEIYIGRKFTSRISLLPPDLQEGVATTTPSQFKINYLNLYLYKSLNIKVNDQLVELKQFNQNLFERPKPFTGHTKLEMAGWQTFNDFKIEIEQTEPLPMHITALVMEYNFNDG